MKSGKSGNISFRCLSRFGITGDVFDMFVEDVADDGLSFGLLSLSLFSVFRFLFGDASLDTSDNARLGAIVNLSGSKRSTNTGNVSEQKLLLLSIHTSYIT